MAGPAASDRQAGPARLSVRALTKTFGSARVLTDVELTVRPGEVHGLAGQNGSGKSTLIKIVTGLYTPDPGAEFEVDGEPVRLPVRWPEVHAAGISVVHQDLGLLDQLTVAENICIGGFPTTRLGRISRVRRDELAARTLDRLGVPLDPGPAGRHADRRATGRGGHRPGHARPHPGLGLDHPGRVDPGARPALTWNTSTSCCAGSPPTAAPR